MAAVCASPGWRSPSEGGLGRREEEYSRDGNHPLGLVWEGVKRAGGGVVSPQCDTPTGRRDEGGKESCRVLCDYLSPPHRVGDGVRIYLIIDWTSSLKKCPKKKCPKKKVGKMASDFYIGFFSLKGNTKE